MFLTYKPIGISPLEHLSDLKKQEKIKSKKSSYAGRLDPMAHGLMIYLSDEYCKKQDNFIGLDKTYKFKIAFGITTDTYDILGKIKKISSEKINIEVLKSIINNYIGSKKQYYPPYCSYKINGKPLWKHSLDGTLDFDLPSKIITIYNLNILNNYFLDFENFRLDVLNKISNLKSNNFRNDEIMSGWEKIKMDNVLILDIIADVSSGTYIRSLCNEIGCEIGVGAIAYDIFRIKIGDYKLDEKYYN